LYRHVVQCTACERDRVLVVTGDVPYSFQIPGPATKNLWASSYPRVRIGHLGKLFDGNAIMTCSATRFSGYSSLIHKLFPTLNGICLCFDDHLLANLAAPSEDPSDTRPNQVPSSFIASPKRAVRDPNSRELGVFIQLLPCGLMVPFLLMNALVDLFSATLLWGWSGSAGIFVLH
jgi:hypothetical protein